ncbi:phosphopantothenoylcysteine synthetase/decarboxylase [Bacillus tianshenii]|uniref:Phosphopantothenoylcysteine synthetase/decarboxylase n=1 Tax=Sutcliffiella tianshenii TaxID=1463404 RepID=A0ABS2P6I7_9BACI|nr:hypothetical protein [Bacillus tianshenii]MBM7622025.1 phosphopantothenoylcysteine synthetase/decarboxylase [Bacillus tianshenii]
MTNEVRKAKLKLDFENGFSLAPDLNSEVALQAVLKALKNGDVSEVKIAVEYNDGTEVDFEEEDEVDEAVEAENNDDDDDEDEDDDDDDEDEDDDDDDEDEDDDDDDEEED